MVVSTADSSPRREARFASVRFLCKAVDQTRCGFLSSRPGPHVYSLSMLHPFPSLTSSVSVTFIRTWELSSHFPQRTTPLSEHSCNLNTVCTELCVLIEQIFHFFLILKNKPKGNHEAYDSIFKYYDNLSTLLSFNVCQLFFNLLK